MYIGIILLTKYGTDEILLTLLTIFSLDAVSLIISNTSLQYNEGQLDTSSSFCTSNTAVTVFHIVYEKVHIYNETKLIQQRNVKSK